MSRFNKIYDLTIADFEEAYFSKALGEYYLGYSPVTGDCEIFFVQPAPGGFKYWESKEWDRYIPIPSWNPEGSGRELDRAREFMFVLYSTNEAVEIMKKLFDDDVSLSEWLEENHAESWNEYKNSWFLEEVTDFLENLNKKNKALQLKFNM